MALGGNFGNYAPQALYHISNGEFSRILSSGVLLLGSENITKNVSTIWIGDASVSLASSSFSIISPQSSVYFLNDTSTFDLTAENSSIELKAPQNITIDANVVFSMSGSRASLSIGSDYQCAIESSVTKTDSHFSILPLASLTVESSMQQLVVAASAIEIHGLYNISSIKELRFEGAFPVE